MKDFLKDFGKVPKNCPLALGAIENGVQLCYICPKKNDMNMNDWKELCKNVWNWLVKKPQVVNVKKPQVEKVLKGYSPDRMKRYLDAHYEFRYNVLSEVNEFRPKGEDQSAFKLLGKRELNALCMEIQSAGIPCWDRDVARYIHSTLVEDYHPFTLYIQELPKWDGEDRLTDLAQRVSSEAYWVKHFHRWMLALMAQWMGKNTTYANCVAPLLVSEEQGWLKSTFCKSLMPEPLQAYYTDQIDLSANGRLEGKLAVMGLINLDEFDRLSSRAMAKLKNLMQLSSLSIRKAYQKNYAPLPRIASFIGTSNRKDLLDDPTGSRRFLCVEVEHRIDCSDIDLPQIYAQLKAELEAGERYWFTPDEEQEIQCHNEAFYQVHPEEELFRNHFRTPSDGETCEMLSLSDILETLKEKHGALLRNVSMVKFGNALVASGVERVHTKLGNRYKLVRVDVGE